MESENTEKGPLLWFLLSTDLVENRILWENLRLATFLHPQVETGRNFSVIFTVKTQEAPRGESHEHPPHSP
jgi:hypothetical protein